MRQRIADLVGRLDALGGIFNYDAKRERLEEVERELENPDVWNDSERAQALGRERSLLDKTVNGIRELTDGLGRAGELLDLVEAEDDEETANAIVADVDRYEKGVDQKPGSIRSVSPHPP